HHDCGPWTIGWSRRRLHRILGQPTGHSVRRPCNDHLTFERCGAWKSPSTSRVHNVQYAIMLPNKTSMLFDNFIPLSLGLELPRATHLFPAACHTSDLRG